MRRLRANVALGICLGALVAAVMTSGAVALASTNSCTKLCARSADGLVYRILGEYRFTDAIGNPVEALPFTITNDSRRSEVFAPVPGGFTAVLSTGGIEQFTQYEGPSQADPDCFPPDATEPDGLTPLGYTVKPGHTRGPLEVCMALSPGQTLVKGLFADNNPNLHQNAVIRLTGSIPHLRTPFPLAPSKPSPWSLPDPADLPATALSGIGAFQGPDCHPGLHVYVNRGTRRAYRSCTQDVIVDLVLNVYVGFVPPTRNSPGFPFDVPFSARGGVAIPGFPDAELFKHPFPAFWPRAVAVRFTRIIRGKKVYAQVAAGYTAVGPRGFSQCPQANRIANVEIAARALFKLLGPGSAPRLSLPPRSPYCPVS